MSGTILEQYQLLRQTQPTCRVLQVWIAAASRFASTGRQKTCLKWLEKAFFQVYTYIYIYIYIIWNVIPNQSKLHMVSTDILPLKPNLCCLIASNCASSFHSTDQRVLKHQWARYSITLLGMTKKGMPYIAIPSSHCSRPSRIIIFSYSFGLVHHQSSMAGDAAVRSTSKEEAEKQSSAVPGHSDFRGVI